MVIKGSEVNGVLSKGGSRGKKKKGGRILSSVRELKGGKVGQDSTLGWRDEK